MVFMHVSFKKPKNLTDWTKITTKILTLSENHFEGNVNKFATINSKDLPKLPVWKKKKDKSLTLMVAMMKNNFHQKHSNSVP